MYICHNFMWLRWIRWMTDCFQLTVGWYREGGCIIVAASMVILVAVDHTSFAKWGSTSFRFSLVSLKSAALWGAGNEVCLKTKSPNIHWRKCESSFSISKGYLIGKIWEHTSFLPTKTLVLTQHAWMILWQDPQPSSLHRHPWRRRGFALPGSYPSWLAPHNWHQQYWLPPPMFISYMRVILKGTIHSLVPSNFAWPLSIVLFPTKKGSFTHSGVDQIDWPRFQPLKCCALHPPSSNLWPSWSVHYPLHELVPHLCLGSNERFSIFFPTSLGVLFRNIAKGKGTALGFLENRPLSPESTGFLRLHRPSHTFANGQWRCCAWQSAASPCIPNRSRFWLHNPTKTTSLWRIP